MATVGCIPSAQSQAPGCRTVPSTAAGSSARPRGGQAAPLVSAAPPPVPGTITGQRVPVVYGGCQGQHAARAGADTAIDVLPSSESVAAVRQAGPRGRGGACCRRMGSFQSESLHEQFMPTWWCRLDGELHFTAAPSALCSAQRSWFKRQRPGLSRCVPPRARVSAPIKQHLNQRLQLDGKLQAPCSSLQRALPWWLHILRPSRFACCGLTPVPVAMLPARHGCQPGRTAHDSRVAFRQLWQPSRTGGGAATE